MNERNEIDNIDFGGKIKMVKPNSIAKNKSVS
jgi:hypothetical protein